MSTIFKITPQAKAMLLIVLSPLVVILPFATWVAFAKVNESLEQFGNGFVDRVDSVIDEVYFEHNQVMTRDLDCHDFRDELFVDSTFREMLLVEKGVVICSSRLGKTHADLTHLFGNKGVKSGEYLHNRGADPSQRTLIIVNTGEDDPTSGVFSIIDRDYLNRNIGEGISDRIHALKFRVGHQTYPEYAHFDSELIHVLIDSSQYTYQIIVEAKPAFVRHMLVYIMTQAILLSLLISFVLTLCRRAFEQRNSVVDDLRRGLEREELYLVYQPIISSERCEVVGAEALIRWVHPHTGAISPEIFIPLAEQYGLVAQLTDFVLARVQHDLSRLTNQPFEYVAVNIPPNYLHQPRHLGKILSAHHAMTSTGLSLCVEVTERQFLDERARHSLTKLKEAGIKVSLDDFGTGHTALSVIQQVHFDVLKVDKCFVDSIGLDAVNSPVLEAIIDLGHRLGVEIVAEGVETQAQAEFLRAAGAHYQQGYYFSQPLSVNELTGKIDLSRRQSRGRRPNVSTA